MRTRANPNKFYHSRADLPPQPPQQRPVRPEAPRPQLKTSREVKEIILPDQTVRVFYDSVGEEFTALARGRYGYIHFACPSLGALTHGIKRALAAPDKN